MPRTLGDFFGRLGQKLPGRGPVTWQIGHVGLPPEGGHSRSGEFTPGAQGHHQSSIAHLNHGLKRYPRRIADDVLLKGITRPMVNIGRGTI